MKDTRNTKIPAELLEKVNLNPFAPLAESDRTAMLLGQMGLPRLNGTVADIDKVALALGIDVAYEKARVDGYIAQHVANAPKFSIGTKLTDQFGGGVVCEMWDWDEKEPVVIDSLNMVADP